MLVRFLSSLRTLWWKSMAWQLYAHDESGTQVGLPCSAGRFEPLGDISFRCYSRASFLVLLSKRAMSCVSDAQEGRLVTGELGVALQA